MSLFRPLSTLSPAHQAIPSLGIAPPFYICVPIHQHSRLSFYSERVRDLTYLLPVNVQSPQPPARYLDSLQSPIALRAISLSAILGITGKNDCISQGVGTQLKPLQTLLSVISIHGRPLANDGCGVVRRRRGMRRLVMLVIRLEVIQEGQQCTTSRSKFRLRSRVAHPLSSSQSRSQISWKHPNLVIGYVAQHAFQYIDHHLDKAPLEYMLW